MIKSGVRLIWVWILALHFKSSVEHWTSSNSLNFIPLISTMGLLSILQSCCNIKWDNVAKFLGRCLGLVTEYILATVYGWARGATRMASTSRSWGPTWIISKSHKSMSVWPPGVPYWFGFILFHSAWRVPVVLWPWGPDLFCHVSWPSSNTSYYYIP